MLDDMAMQQPVAEIVGDEAEFGLFVGQKQDGVGRWRQDGPLVRIEDAEAQAVQVDRVRMRRAVATCST